jgi:CBS domain-containing protein
MTTARDVMVEGVECVGENETLVIAAQKMRDLDVGALPICGEDGKLKGMLTDRDIVVKCIADGGDPSSVNAGSLGEGKPVTVGADDDIETVLDTMKKHQVRRLPVIDGHTMVGIIAQADLAAYLPEAHTGDLVQEISEPE